jgi:hypothetical protein
MSPLRVWVNGGECSESVGEDVSRAARELKDPALSLLIEGEADILSLARARDEGEYLARHIQLMRIRSSVDPSRFEPTRRPGLLGRAAWHVRRLLWRVLRYQHDWFVFHNNAIHHQLTSEIDNLHAETRRRLDDVERRLKQLESGSLTRLPGAAEPDR